MGFSMRVWGPCLGQLHSTRLVTIRERLWDGIWQASLARVWIYAA
jgi:hypothetical protein